MAPEDVRLQFDARPRDFGRQVCAAIAIPGPLPLRLEVEALQVHSHQRAQFQTRYGSVLPRTLAEATRLFDEVFVWAARALTGYLARATLSGFSDIAVRRIQQMKELDTCVLALKENAAGVAGPMGNVHITYLRYAVGAALGFSTSGEAEQIIRDANRETNSAVSHQAAPRAPALQPPWRP
eukprot:3573985-Rhodomonas_salina.1